LKPFPDNRFFQALDRAKRRVRERRAEAAAASASETAGQRTPDNACEQTRDFITRLAIGHGPHGRWINVSDVLWIEAEDYCVLLHTREGRHLLRTSMSSLEERLDPRLFVRSHRAAIVNVHEVARIEADTEALVLSDGTRVAVSRSRRAVVERVAGAGRTTGGSDR
jgi:two-component system LytT family response regulator